MNVTLTRKEVELILVALAGMADEMYGIAPELNKNLETLHSKIWDEFYN